MNTPIKFCSEAYFFWLKVPPGRPQPALNPRALDLEKITLPRDHRGRLIEDFRILKVKLEEPGSIQRCQEGTSKEGWGLDWTIIPNLTMKVPQYCQLSGLNELGVTDSYINGSIHMLYMQLVMLCCHSHFRKYNRVE